MQTHEHPTLARRSLLAGLAALPMASVVAVPVLPAAAAASSMDALWQSYLTARHALQAANHAWRCAYDQLPWWVRPGPSFLRSDGTIDGAVSCAPAIQDVTLPEQGTSRLIRPTEASIERDHHLRRGMMRDADRDAWRDMRLAGLRDRQAAAQVEHDRRNLPALNQVEEDASEIVYAMEDAILALEPTTPATIAMQIMLQVKGEADESATVAAGCEMGVAALGLRGVLPMLTGEIAATARDFIADPERRLDQMRLYRGIEAAALA